MSDGTSPAAPIQPNTSTTPAASSQQPTQQDGSFKRLMTMMALIVFGLGAIVVGLGTAFAGEGGKGSTLADMLGQQPRDAIALLSLIAHGYFAALTLVLLIVFITALIGWKRTPAGTAGRGGKIAKTIGFGLLFMIGLGAWFFTFLFLSTRADTFPQGAPKPAVITTPASTIGLSAPVTITFDASGFVTNINVKQYEPISYLWDFGDNQSGTGEVVSHEYTDKGRNEGKFQARLSVTLRNRQTNEQTAQELNPIPVTIKNIRPTVVFTATPEKGAAPLTVNFDASDSKDPDGQITAYNWDMDGDGQFNDATGKTAQYTYKKSGKFTMGLELTDNSGEKNTITRDIEVSDSFAVKATIDATGELNGKFVIGKSYLFDGKRSSSPNGKISKYAWTFGDNTAPQSGRSVNHAYNANGIYEVTLTVTDEAGASASSTKKIPIGAEAKKPTVVIETTPTSTSGKLTGNAPLTVAFDASKSTSVSNNIVDYSWDFNGDGTADASGPTQSYTFEKDGTYTAKLTITDADDNEGTATLNVVVAPPGIKAKFGATPITGVIPLTVKFDATASTFLNGQIIGYEWDFGDGAPKRQDAATISYKYTKIGVFKPSVTVIGSDGTKDTTNVTVTVQNVPVKACFSVNKKQAKVGSDIVFNANCTTGTIAKYRWDFNEDGIFDDASGPQVSHAFTDAKAHKISLEVTDMQGVVDTFTDTITITGE